MRTTDRRQAFTLIELMIVVAIIAVLIALLLPSLSRAKQQAMQVACAANLNAIFKGMFYYAQDPNNGNGYLPNLGGHRLEWFRNWTGQICPYIKIKRTRLGSRNSVLVCPAHEEPQLRWVCGPQAGFEASATDKLRSDTGQGNGVRRRGRGSGDSGPLGHLGPPVEPVSYTGSCDTLETRTVASMGGSNDIPRKWATIDRLHCFVMLTEVSQDSSRDARCFRFAELLSEARTHPDYKRHYGGQNPMTNGSNFLFADGHVRWHSADFTAGRLICCVDFGFRDSDLSPSGNSAVGESVKRQNCTPGNGGGTTRRR